MVYTELTLHFKLEALSLKRKYLKLLSNSAFVYHIGFEMKALEGENRTNKHTRI